MKILLHLSYIGTGYCGYQVQPNGISIQQRLNEAAKDLFGFDCDIVGCSRTDSGVHANHFCAAVTERKKAFLPTSIPPEKIAAAMNVRLPSDIAVFAAEYAEDTFHPRYDVKYKEYVYKIWNAPCRNPFLEGRAWHCPKKINDEAFERMKKAASYFVGKQDFASFMAADSKISDSVREVYESLLTKEGDLICFKVSADGFLYNMVRIFVGTLIDVAYGKIDPKEIPSIILKCDRSAAGQTAPPHGLYLNKVVY